MADKQKLNLGFDTQVQIDYNWDKATKDFYKDFSNWVKSVDVSTLKNRLNSTVDDLLNAYVSRTSQSFSEKVVETVRLSLEDAKAKANAELEKTLVDQEKAMQKRIQDSFKSSDFKKMQDAAKKYSQQEFRVNYGKEGRQKALGGKKDITKAEKQFKRDKEFALKAQKEYFDFLESPLPSITKEDKNRRATLRRKQTMAKKAGKSLGIQEVEELNALEQKFSDDEYKRSVLKQNLGIKKYDELIVQAKKYHEIRVNQEKEYAKLLEDNNKRRIAGVSEADIAKHRETQREVVRTSSGKQYNGEASRVSAAAHRAQIHRKNNEDTLKKLNAKAFSVELDEDSHTYYKLNQDGKRSKKQPEIVSVTQFASAISSGDWIKPLMDKVAVGAKKGLLPEQVLNKEELKSYNNVNNAALRGTAIHKVIELLETDAVSSVDEAVKFLDKEVAELTAQGKKNPYGTEYKDSKGGFTWSKTIGEYFELKNKYGLGNAVLSEKQLGMQVSVPQNDGTSKLIHLAGTLDTLLSGGHLFDYKTTSELHGQNLTVQDNLLSLLLTASKQKGIVTQDAGDMGVIHLNAGQRGAEGTYAAKIGQATSDEIISWFQAYVSGKKLNVQSRVEQQFEPMEWEMTRKNKEGKDIVIANSRMQGYGPTIGMGGKTLGHYANAYNKEYAKANPTESGLTVVDESVRDEIRARRDLSDKQKEAILKTTVTVSEMIEAQRKMQDIVNKLMSGYNSSSDEMKEEFAKRVFKTGYGGTDIEKETSLQDFEGLKYNLYSELRKQMSKEMSSFDQDVTESWRIEPKKDENDIPEQGQERVNWIRKRLREEGVGSGPIQSVTQTENKIANKVKELNILIDSLEKARIEGGSEEQIASIEKSIENVAKDFFSTIKNSRKEVESSYIDRFGVERVVTSDFTSDTELVSNEKNIMSIQQALGQGRSQATVDFINNRLFNLSDDKYKENISMQDYTNISSKKILKLVEASVTMDKAFAELAKTLNITTDEAKDLLFQSNESLKTDYDMGTRARNAFLNNGAMPKNTEEVKAGINRMLGLGYKDISNLFTTLGMSDKGQVYNQVLESINKGVGGRTAYGNNFDDNIADIMLGKSPFLSQKIDYSKLSIQEDGTQGSMATQGIEGMLKILNEWKTWDYANSDLTKAIQMLTQILNVKKVGEISNDTPVSHRVFYDTETTGTDKLAMPVTFGAYNTKDGTEYHKYLDYGSDKANLEMAIKAMNIKGDDGALIKSSIELRNSFGILEDEILDLSNISKETKDKILNEYNSNKVNPEQLMSDIMGMVGESGGVAGFNNKSFDNEILGRYMMQQGSPLALSEFQKFLQLPNQDILQEATNAFGKNGNFTGQLNLQSLAELFLGQMDEKSHNAAADAKTTALIADFVNNGVLSLIGQMTKDLATESGTAITNAEGYFTDGYKKIVANTFGIIKELGMGTTLSSGDMDSVKGIVKDRMSLSQESAEIEEINQDGKEHIDIVEGMADAEKQKIIVSKELAAQLIKEEKAIEGVTDAVQENITEESKQNTAQEQVISQADALIQQYQDKKKQDSERRKLIKEAKEKNKPSPSSAELSRHGAKKTAKVPADNIDSISTPIDEKFYQEAKEQDLSKITYEKEKNALREIISIDKQALKLVEKNAQQRELITNIEKRQKDLKEQGQNEESETFKLLQKQKEEMQQQLTLDSQLYNGLLERRNLIAQNIKSDNGQKDLRDQNTTYQIEAQSAAERGIRAGITKENGFDTQIDKLQEKKMKEHMTALKLFHQYDRDRARLLKDGEGLSGQALRDNQAQIAYTEQLMGNQQKILALYDSQNGKIGDIELSEKNILEFEKDINTENVKHGRLISRIGSQYNKQRSILSEIMGGFRNAFRNITDASLAYAIINKVKMGINQVITATKELDKALVDIQIATGQTRSATRELLIEYNGLAKEMGRTTQSVAVASNDWLRAGYEGKEAAELTRASMMLSTLGMIEASEATTYLISTLKGWKIEASEVIDVVDKLTAVDMQAAISAGDLALAMSRANASARIAGSDMNNFIGYVTTIADRTQKSAESVGESMKTLYARYGNVKVNKFSASQAEMESSSYNEEEYENLNDLETVLDSLGIKLRENAKEWRDFDTVIQDIAEHWDNWDLTTKNAVSTAFAGTRQRENFLTLMDSWEDVGKYAEIASDAYGTATSKMEAYTDSIEAAQQRVQSAIEAWALWANGAGVIKDFYNGLAFAIENIHHLVLAIGTLALALNFNSVLTTFSTGITQIASKMASFGLMFDKAKINFAVGKTGGFKALMGDFFNENYMASQQQIFAKALQKYSNTLSQAEIMTAQSIQSTVLNIKEKDKETLAKAMSGQLEMQEIISGQNGLSLEAQKHLAEALLTQTTNEAEKAMLQLIIDANEQSISSDNLTQAQNYLAKRLLGVANGQNGAVGKTIGKNIEIMGKMPNAGVAAAQGAGMMVGSMLGGSAFGTIGKTLLGDSGQIYGTMLGGMIGSSAGKAIGAGIATAVKSGAKAGLAAIPGLGWVAIGATVAGLFFSHWKKKQEEKIIEAQEAFKKAEEKYSMSKSSNITAQEYDKLAKGVDSLGRNVSLTDEEYQDFLNKSNELAELFPELIVRTDEEGNKLVGLGNTVGGVADEVSNLNNELRHLSDEALLNDNVFNNAFDEAYEGIRQKELKINNLRRGTASTQDYKNIYDKYNIGYTENANNQIIVNEEDMDKIDSAIEMAIQEYEKEIDNLKGTMEDYIQAESRELQYNSEGFKKELEEMSEEAKKIYNDMISDIDLRKKDANGNFEKNLWTGDYVRKSDEEIQQEIQDIADFIDSSFDTIGIENIEIAFKAPEDYETLGQIDEARKQLLTSLVNAFGEEFDEKELKILVALGFEVDEDGDVIDNNNKFKQIKKQFASARGKASFWLPNDEDEFLRNLSTNDIDSLQDLLESNSINKNTSLDTISKWLLQESPVTNNLRGKTDFYGRMVGQTQSFNADMTAFLNENSATLINAKIWDSNEVDALIDDYFSDYRANVRGQIKNVAKEFKGANSDELAEAQARMFSLGGSMTISNEIEAQMDMAKQAVSDAFDDISDFGDDGLINTFEELKTVVDDLASSMERLKEARKEDTTQNKLSVATVLDLINTDKNYINALQIVDGKIRLKADAENIVAQAQINAMKASIQAQIATDMETVAKLKSELASLSAGEATAEEISTENSHVQALGEEVKAIDAATNAERRRTAAKIAGAMADAGNLSGAQSWYAKSQGTADDVTTSFSASTVEVPTVMSPEEQQARMEEIGKQLKELTGNDYLKWDEKGEYLMYDPEDRTIDAETGYYSGGSIGIMQHLQDGITVEDLYSGKYAYDSDSGDDKTPLEKLQELESAINKEWEAMMAKKEGRYTEYFKKMRVVLLQEEAMIKGMLASVPQNSAEYLDYLKQLQEVQVKLNNLNDEELEDKMKNLETIESTVVARIALQHELVKSADTEEELIERQKELNDLLKEEQELRRDIRDYQRELIETELEYESGTPDSKRYKNLVNQQKALYEADMAQARLAIQDARNEAYQSFKSSNIDINGNAIYTDSELWNLANNSEDVQEAVKNYIEAFQSAAELAMQVVEDKINALDKKLDTLENGRPNEWTSTSDIKDFYREKIDLLQDKIDIWEEALEDTNNLTDEQITELVDSINDATKELQEAKIARREDIKEQDDKYYEAVVWQVNQYIEEIELAKKVNDDWYDDAIKKLQDYNDDLDRTNKLLELQNKLKAASQEKERVYREGKNNAFKQLYRLKARDG